MPDSLRVASGERVDLVDYVLGANGYTQASQNLEFEREWLDRRSRILDGFRVQVEDQTINPGQITVYNGNAADRAGQLTNNEQVVNDARSITLLGANSVFYVEIEFIQNPSGTDGRFFWDPTILNTPPAPNGSEFGLNIATRLTPDWRIVSPVSSTGFEQTTNANSVRIPVGVFHTDGANRIAGGSNPGLSLVRAASVLELDTLIGDNIIRVIDNRVFPATLPFNVIVDFGGAAPEARTVSSIDRANGLLTLSVNLASAHKTGAIIRVTSGTALLMQEKTDPSDPAGHPDPAQRLWQANETRGSALTTSKEVFGNRDDLGIRSLKDQIDALSAQIRELKFGSQRPEVVAAAPPRAFGARPRWFDSAGGVQGARTNSAAIGNGTTSFGDFNLTAYSDASAMLTAAIAALPAAGGTIYVKPGTYQFPTTVSNTKALVFIGESYANTIFSSTNAGGAAISTTGTLRFVNMSYTRGGGAAANTLDVTSATNVQFDYSVFIGQVHIVNVNATILAANTAFIAASAQPIITGTTNTSVLKSSRFSRCSFTAAVIALCSTDDVVFDTCYGSAASIVSITDGTLFGLKVTNCQMAVATVCNMLFGSTGVVDGVFVHNNKFNVSSLLATLYLFGFLQAANTDHVHISGNHFNVTGGTSSEASPAYIFKLSSTSSSTDISITDNVIEAYAGSAVIPAHVDQTVLSHMKFCDNVCSSTYGLVRIDAAVGAMTAGNFDISGNVHDDAAQHNNVTGVLLAGNPGVSRISVTNNWFLNYNSASGVGNRIAIDFSTNNVGSPITFLASGNHISDITGGASLCFGILYAPSAGTQANHLTITDNSILRVWSPGVCAAIQVAPTVLFNLTRCTIAGNIVDTVGAVAVATANGIGIFLQNVIGASHITRNIVYSTYGQTISTGIEVQDSSAVDIVGNKLFGLECSGGAAFTAGGAGIRFQANAVAVEDIHIVDNSIKQSVAVTPVNAPFGIVLYMNGHSLNRYRITGNSIRTSTNCNSSIVTSDFTNSEGLSDGIVSNNIIACNNTTGVVGVLDIALSLGGPSRNLLVSGNVINEIYNAAAMPTHIGINIQGHAVGGNPTGVKVQDNVLIGVKAGGAVLGPHAGRIGILVRGYLAQTITSGNLVDWNEAGLVTGIGIQYKAFGAGPATEHLIANNLVRGDNDNTSGDEIDIDSAGFTYGYVTGNVVGIAGAPGTITALGATWDNGLNVVAGTNTFFGANKLS